MKIFRSRIKKTTIVIVCDNEKERSSLLCYSKNIGLTATKEKNKFYASIEQVPENEFQDFINELSK